MANTQLNHPRAVWKNVRLQDWDQNCCGLRTCSNGSFLFDRYTFANLDLLEHLAVGISFANVKHALASNCAVDTVWTFELLQTWHVYWICRVRPQKIKLWKQIRKLDLWSNQTCVWLLWSICTNHPTCIWGSYRPEPVASHRLELAQVPYWKELQ